MSNYVYEEEAQKYEMRMELFIEDAMETIPMVLGYVAEEEEYNYPIDNMRKNGDFGKDYKTGYVCRPATLFGTLYPGKNKTFTVTMYVDSNNDGVPDSEQPGA